MAGLVVLGIAAAFVMPAVWRSQPADRGVVAEWNETISRLGIDPVFPPEEDIYVGDVFAVITGDTRPGTKTRDEPLLNRAIKLTHIDMTKELDQQYAALPVFPETEKRPANGSDPWLQKQAATPPGLFGNPSGRSILAIAAFPGFTIKNERGAAGGLSSFGAGLFGAARRDSDVIEVKIPFAETYGLPTLVAAGRLAAFCADPFTKGVCTDEVLRRNLSYVNPAVLSKESDPATGRPRYRLNVEIALVNRVYLTRSIEQTRRLGQGNSAAVEALGRASPVSKPDETLPNPQGPQPSAEKRTDETVARLDRSAPGATVSVTSGSDREYSLNQTFQRPIVIGYRAVRAAFPDNLDTLDRPEHLAGGNASDGK